MENTTAIIGLITAIVSFIAAIIPLIIMVSPKKNKEIPTISIRGKNNNVTQDNSTYTNTTYIEHKQVIYVSSGNSSTSNDDGWLMILGMALLLLFLYANRIILLQVMYIPLIISALLSVLICIFYVRGVAITPIHPNNVVNAIFALIPVAISVVFMVQNKLFLFDMESVEFSQKLQIGTTILFNYLGIFFLLFTQLCVLVVSHIKFLKIRKFIINISRIWPAAAILPLIPIILWFVQK